jgi:photoactive yellow protein
MDSRENAVKQMWQQIQVLQVENRKLRDALESLGHADMAGAIGEVAPMAAPPFEVEQLVFAQRAATTASWPVRRAVNGPAYGAPPAPPAPRPVAVQPQPAAQMAAPPMPAAQMAAPPMPAAAGGFSPSNIDVGVVRQLTSEQLNSLPYGVVIVDREGTVLGYNDTESRLAQVPRDRVLMRSFFRDVAPCAQVKEFEGRFHAFTRGETRSMVEQFDFVFNFAHGAQHVTILITPGRSRGTFNILMTRR